MQKFHYKKTTQIITALISTGITKNQIAEIRLHKALSPVEFLHYLKEHHSDVFFEGVLRGLPEFHDLCDWRSLTTAQILKWAIVYQAPPPAASLDELTNLEISVLLERFGEDFHAFDLTKLTTDDWNRILLWRSEMINRKECRPHLKDLDWKMLGVWQESLIQYIPDENIKREIEARRNKIIGEK